MTCQHSFETGFTRKLGRMRQFVLTIFVDGAESEVHALSTQYLPPTFLASSEYLLF